MKKLFSLIFVAISLIAFTSHAQSYSAPIVLSTGITNIPGSTAYNASSNAIIDCTRSQVISIQVSVKSDGANTANTGYEFARSLDRSNWDTTQKITLFVPNNGTTASTCCTNINVGGVGYLKLISITNAAASAVNTNILIQYSIKKQAP